MYIIKLIINFFKRLKRRYIIAKATTAMEKVVEDQAKLRKALRTDINVFLRQFFGIDAHSKFIPKNYKNKEEVTVAVMDKFGDRMTDLNLKYSDLFR